MAEHQLSTLLDGGAFFESPRWHDGHWWVSDFFQHRVIRVDTRGREQELLTVQGRPSGLGWMPDGSLTGRRVRAQLAATPTLTTLPETLAQLRSGPDGCSLDADGYIWPADEVTARCLRIAPGGEIVDEIAMPAGLVCFACMLGGDDGCTLLVCASPDFDHVARESALLTTRVDVPHAGLP